MSRIAITSQLMTALFQSFNTLFQKGYAEGQTFYQSIVTPVPSTTSKEVYGWLGQMTGFRKWVGERVIQRLKTHSYTITNVDFENTVAVSVPQIEDDEFGVLAPVFEQLGRDAKEHPDELVAAALKAARTELCYDGKPFLATDHPVLLSKDKNKVTAVSNLTAEAGDKPTWFVIDGGKVIKPLLLQKRKDYTFVRKDKATDDCVFNNNEAIYGADARLNVGYAMWQQIHGCDKALTADNFKAVRKAMRGLKGDNGRPLRIRETEIWVPTALMNEAEAIFQKKMLADGSDNELFNAVKVVVNPYLD